ncbi:MAG: hypothetical protein V1808_01140 [Candidatus Daviesbacteria bacterium]
MTTGFEIEHPPVSETPNNQIQYLRSLLEEKGHRYLGRLKDGNHLIVCTNDWYYSKGAEDQKPEERETILLLLGDGLIPLDGIWKEYGPVTENRLKEILEFYSNGSIGISTREGAAIRSRLGFETMASTRMKVAEEFPFTLNHYFINDPREIGEAAGEVVLQIQALVQNNT